MKPQKIQIDIRVALLYLIFGGVWILLSDSILAILVSDHDLYMQMQTYKGWAFVAASAVLVYFVLRREASEASQAEKNLRESEEHYRLLFEATPIGIYRTTASGKIMDANPTLVKMLGYADLETLKKVNVTDLYADPQVREQKQKLLEQTGSAPDSELQLVRKDGRRMWVKDTHAASTSTGQMIFEGALEDITERKRAEEALRHSQQQLLLLVEQAPLSIAMFDREMRYIAASQRWVAEYGRGAQNLTGLSHYELNPNLPERWKESHRKGLEGEFLKNNEDLWVHDDGTEEWLRWAIVPWYDAEDRIGGIILSAEDITERKRAETLQDAVYRIAKAAETSESLNDLYPRIHQIISSVMRAENFYIMLYDEKQDILRFPYFKDDLDEPYLEEIHPGMGLTAYVLRTGKSLLCTQAVHDELERQGAVKLLGVPSKIWLGVPLTVENKTIGVMVVQHYSDPQAYGEREQHILEFVSSQVATAIQRKQSEEALQRRADELSALQAIILDMTSPRPLNETLETIVKRAVALLDGNSGGMYLSESQERRVRCVVSYNTPSDYTGTILNYGEGAAGQVAESGEPLLIDDYRTWPGRAAIFDEEQPFEAIVSVPLLSKGQVIGVIHVIRGRKFSREELGLLSLFANHATVAVERARLLDSVRENEERYRLLFENAPVGILSAKSQGQILEVNPSALQILGSPSAEATKKINMLTFPPLIEAGISADVQRCFETRQPIVAEHFYTTKWGKSIDVHYQLVPIPDEHGQIGQVQCLVEDITERKQAEILQEAVYRISEAAQKVGSLEELFHEVHIIIGGVMPADNFYIALLDEENEQMRYPYYMDEQDGWNPFPTAPIGRGMTEYVLRTGRSLLCGPELFADLVERGEVELVGAPSLVWLGVPLAVGNRVIGIMAVQDYNNPQAYGERELRMLEYVSGQVARVIERQQSEEELREKESRYRGLFEDSPISLWEQDFSEVKKRLDALRQKGITDFAAYLESHPQEVIECAALVRVVDVNKATLRLYRAEEKEDLLKDLKQFFRDETYRQFQNELVKIADGRTQFEWEGINQTLDGRQININLSWSVSPGHEEDLSRVIISIVDITERKQAEDTTLAQKKELEALFSLSTRLSVSQNEHAILPIVLEEIKTVFETDGSAAILLDSGGEQFVTGLADGPLTSTIGYRHNVKEGAAGQVYQTRNPLLVENYASYDHRVINAPEADKLGSSIFAPIQSEDQFLGVLQATHMAGKEAHPFNEDALRLLAIMGQMVGNALRRVRLYQQALERLNHLQGLQNINTVIANSLDLGLSLNALVKEVCGQMKIDAAAAYILDPYSQMLNYGGGEGLRTHSVPETRLNLGEACAGAAALEGRLVSITDLSLNRSPICRNIMEREGFVRMFAFPMLAKGKVRGVLQVFHRAPYVLDMEREALLKALAGQAALAIDNIQLFDDLQQSNFRLAMAYDATIEGWSNALDLRDKETEGHTQRVTDLTLELARAIGITGLELVHLRRGALLHDIGKMGVPDHILLKPDALTPQELIEMRLHPAHAYKMLSQIQFLHPALDIPHHHHERWDGSGYPDGLKGEQIPLHARLFAVVDVWDALTSDRPYRKAWTRKRALTYLREQSGRLFDPQVVDEFLRLIQTDKT